MESETITIPREVLLKLAENNKMILAKLERIKERLKNRRAFFSFFVDAA